MNLRWIIPTVYIIFLMLPIYWLLNMSFKTTNEILGGFSWFPAEFTVESYVTILTDPSWYWGYKLDHLCRYKHSDLGHGRPARCLCVFALSFPGRQAPVLLASNQQNGTTGSFRIAVSGTLFLDAVV